MKIDGLININKEKGYTSHDVVAKLRGILHEKKIGHTGTLDPDATGVLPVCIGKGTKVVELIMDKRKRYIAKGVLGIVTDTQDISGEIIAKSENYADKDAFCDILSLFLGEIEQIPPMYSAVKVNGKRLYEYAREGKSVERKSRKITIFDLKLLEFNPEENSFAIDVTCSKGTYIRTLINDIGQKLGCGACMSELTRTQSGMFTIDKALTLGEVEEVVKKGKIEDIVYNIDVVFEGLGAAYVNDEGKKLLLNGCKIPAEFVRIEGKFNSGESFRVYDEDGAFRAIYKYNEKSNMMVLEKMFFN